MDNEDKRVPVMKEQDVQDATCERLIAKFQTIDAKTKIAEWPDIPFYRHEGHVECLGIKDLRVGVTKLNDGTYIASATWTTDGNRGNWGDCTHLVIEFGKQSLPLGSVDFGSWSVRCHEEIEHSRYDIPIPKNYFDDADEAAISPTVMRAAAC